MESKEQARVTDEEIRKILISTLKGDWIVSDEFGSYTYRDDALLRIQQRCIDYSKFCEKWATDPHADSVAYRVIYDVYYGESLIATKTLVAVDGMRAIPPMPKRRTSEIPYEEYRFAKIVSPDSLDEYIGRSGLTVESPNVCQIGE